ncbi:MAG TPA: IS110 family transposase [Lachnospiraceae bacterium]|nr:IS110 family transposase [Lachnospiraceae bacterium]
MDLVYPICCGLDVHKKNVVASIAVTDPVTFEAKYTVKSFSTMNSDIVNLHNWLKSNHCNDVCMESTGKYWIPIFNILEKDMHVVLTHPKYVKAIKGKKTDKRDAKWISNLFRFDIVRSSFIPPEDIRALRELSRYRIKLAYMKSAEKNRYQNSMTISRIRLDCVLTDPFGKTATKLMNYLLTEDNFQENKCLDLLHCQGRLKASPEEILDSIRGYHLLPEQRFKMNHAKEHMDYLNRSISEIEKELFIRTRSYDSIIKHISTMSGLTELSAVLIISEIGVDMSVFDDEKHLASWAGLTPANNESANKKKSTRCSKAGQYLKPLLVQCALAAVKSKKDPYYAIKYQRLKKRRGHKKAIIAIARMMLIAIYHIIKDDAEFKPVDYDEIVNPKPKNNVSKMTVENVLQFLKEQGADENALTLLKKQYCVS